MAATGPGAEELRDVYVRWLLQKALVDITFVCIISYFRMPVSSCLYQWSIYACRSAVNEAAQPLVDEGAGRRRRRPRGQRRGLGEDASTLGTSQRADSLDTLPQLADGDSSVVSTSGQGLHATGPVGSQHVEDVTQSTEAVTDDGLPPIPLQAMSAPIRPIRSVDDEPSEAGLSASAERPPMVEGSAQSADAEQPVRRRRQRRPVTAEDDGVSVQASTEGSGGAEPSATRPPAARRTSTGQSSEDEAGSGDSESMGSGRTGEEGAQHGEGKRRRKKRRRRQESEGGGGQQPLGGVGPGAFRGEELLDEDDVVGVLSASIGSSVVTGQETLTAAVNLPDIGHVMRRSRQGDVIAVEERDHGGRFVTVNVRSKKGLAVVQRSNAEYGSDALLDERARATLHREHEMDDGDHYEGGADGSGARSARSRRRGRSSSSRGDGRSSAVMDGRDVFVPHLYRFEGLFLRLVYAVSGIGGGVGLFSLLLSVMLLGEDDEDLVRVLTTLGMYLSHILLVSSTVLTVYAVDGILNRSTKSKPLHEIVSSVYHRVYQFFVLARDRSRFGQGTGKKGSHQEEGKSKTSGSASNERPPNRYAITENLRDLWAVLMHRCVLNVQRESTGRHVAPLRGPLAASAIAAHLSKSSGGRDGGSNALRSAVREGRSGSGPDGAGPLLDAFGTTSEPTFLEETDPKILDNATLARAVRREKLEPTRRSKSVLVQIEDLPSNRRPETATRIAYSVFATLSIVVTILTIFMYSRVEALLVAADQEIPMWWQAPVLTRCDDVIVTSPCAQPWAPIVPFSPDFESDLALWHRLNIVRSVYFLIVWVLTAFYGSTEVRLSTVLYRRR